MLFSKEVFALKLPERFNNNVKGLISIRTIESD